MSDTLLPPLREQQARDSFRDFVAATLLGPGTDPDSGTAHEHEQVGDFPLKRYYTGVLFPVVATAPTAADSESDEDPLEDGQTVPPVLLAEEEAAREAAEATAGTADTDGSLVAETPEEPTAYDPEHTFVRRGSEPADADYPAANQFFPANMGLTACVTDDMPAITLDISLAFYARLSPTDPVAALRLVAPLPAALPHAYADLLLAPGFPAEWADAETGLLRYEAATHSLHLRRALVGNSAGINRSEDFAVLHEFRKKGNYRLAAMPALERLFFLKVWERYPVRRSVPISLVEGTAIIPLDDLAADLPHPAPVVKAVIHTKVLRRGSCLYVKALLANQSPFADPRRVSSRPELNEVCFFQTTLTLRVPAGRVLSPHRAAANRPFDAEAETLDHLYRNEHAYGQGHSCAACWDTEVAAPAWLRTTWLPQVLVSGTSISLADRQQMPNPADNISPDASANADKVCGLRYLSIWETAPGADDRLRNELQTFVREYDQWHQRQAATTQADGTGEKPVVTKILENQQATGRRLRENVDLLADPQIMHCFRLANTAMLLQMVLSDDDTFGTKEKEPAPDSGSAYDKAIYKELAMFEHHPGRKDGKGGHQPFRYRPFQLAFLLLNLRGIVEPEGAERREQVDLLWFPTGGGKTEAYLALTAFTILWRRLAYGDTGGGVAVLMRYTLRLLTAQQFERAARLICALEFLRQKIGGTYGLGQERISLGMWVGGSTTPNKLDQAVEALNQLSKQFNNHRLDLPARLAEARKRNRFALSSCPWCGGRLIAAHPRNAASAVSGFEASDGKGSKGGFRVFCLDERCFFQGRPGQNMGTGLPIDVVDESLYRRPPALLFATVDKYAQLAHRSEGGRLFGLRGPSEGPDQRPPDLIIQDELHLLNGPLGSVVGLFETAIELLATRAGVAPKIVASTATTRNTAQQVAALYGGRQVAVFPPSGTDYRDSFFARSIPGRRLHLGFLPTGKSGPDTQVRLLAGLLVQRALLLQQIHGKQDDWNKLIDKYWTLVVYFNNLKELGKTSNQVSAEIGEYLRGLHGRFHLPDNEFGFAHRYLDQRTRELTSRVGSHEIKRTLDDLKRTFPAQKPSYDPDTKTRVSKLETVDLVLASNMLSVGIDVERFNLMLMAGQPKNVAEYIQASSRVARQAPGLVISLLNPSRAREKSYFENYVAFNQAYYRAVEPLTVTPYTPVTLNKALNLVLVAWVRHRPGGLPANAQAAQFTGSEIDELVAFLARRIPAGPARAYAQERLAALRDSWCAAVVQNPMLKYQEELIKSPTDLSEWAMLTSMREVDTTTVVQTNPLSYYHR